MKAIIIGIPRGENSCIVQNILEKLEKGYMVQVFWLVPSFSSPFQHQRSNNSRSANDSIT